MTLHNTSFFVLVALALSSCRVLGSLSSQTLIQAHDSFVLGDNAHGRFRAKVCNTSAHDLKVLQVPLSGGSHSPVVVHPQQTVWLQVAANTALRIENPSSETAVVDLVVHGDTGLSMGYQHASNSSITP